MNNIELGIKNDLMFFDNVKSTEAENLSKIYSNYVFFSDEGEIWKNGLRYTSKIKNVSSVCNTIHTSDGNEYRLELKGNTLHLTLYSKYYWYIGNINPFENEVNLPIRNLVDSSSKYMGWRFFIEEENLKIEPDKIFDNIDYININDNVNDYVILNYKGENSAAFNGLYRPFDTNQEFIKLDNAEYVYIAIPKVFIDTYKIGCYDIFMNNYFDNNLYSEATLDYKNSYYIYKIPYTSNYFLLNIIKSNGNKSHAINICNNYSKLTENIDENMYDNYSKMYFNNVCGNDEVSYAYNNVLKSNNYYSDRSLSFGCTYLYYNKTDINKHRFNLSIGTIKSDKTTYKYKLNSTIGDNDNNNVIVNDLYTLTQNNYTYFGILSYYNLDNINSLRYNLSINYSDGYPVDISKFDISINNVLNKNGESAIYTYDSSSNSNEILYNSDIIDISTPTVFFMVNSKRNNNIYPLTQQYSLQLGTETETALGSKYCLVKGLWVPNKSPQYSDCTDLKFCIIFPHYNNYMNYPFVLNNQRSTTIGANIRFIPLEGEPLYSASKMIKTTSDTEHISDYTDYFDLLEYMTLTGDYHNPLTIQISNFEYSLDKFDKYMYDEYIWNDSLTNMIDTIYTIYWCVYENNVIMDSNNNIILENNVIKKYNYNIDYSVCREVYKNTFGEINTFSGISSIGANPKVELNINLKLTDELVYFKKANHYLILCKNVNGEEICDKIIQIYQRDINEDPEIPYTTTPTTSTSSTTSTTTETPIYT